MAVTCKYCRTPFPDGTAMCSVCGNRLPATVAPTPPAPTTFTNSSPTSGINNSPYVNIPISESAQSCQNGSGDMQNPFTVDVALNAFKRSEEFFFEIFSRSDWEDLWERAVESADNQGRKAGIILTNTSGFDSSLSKAFRKNVFEYIEFKSKNGVDYFVLDLSHQAIMSVYTGQIDGSVDIIDKVFKTEGFDYLMILGDFKTVPNIVWENRSRDDDPVVFSDLPYTTLSTFSPFDDILYELDAKLKVGRIPTSVKTGFAEAFTYLKNTMNSKVTKESLKAHFLTTQSWEPTSCNIGKNVGAQLSTSPDCDGDFEFSGSLEPYNVLMFNLHGASSTHYWYGEDDEGCDVAFSAEKLPKNKNYILAAEACYGARPYNDGKNGNSIVSTALSNGCCAFVGSTQIAYGMAGGQLSCADIIEKYFIEDIMDGYSAGASFIDALAYLEGDEWDDCSLKTLMEFALYGDPSYAVIGSTNKAKTKVKQKAFTKNNLSYRIIEGEEQKAVSVKSAYVEESMETNLRAFVEESAPELMDVKPRFFMDECTGDYQAIYKKSHKNGVISKILKVFFKADGSVKKKYISK